MKDFLIMLGVKVAVIAGIVFWALNAHAETLDGMPHSEPMAFEDCLEVIGDKVDAYGLEILWTNEQPGYALIKWEDHARKVQGTYECDARRGVMTEAEWKADPIFRGPKK